MIHFGYYSTMKRSIFVATLLSLVVPAFAKKVKGKRVKVMAEEEGDISVEGTFYSANSSFPYETAVLTGPGFEEGTMISKSFVQGQLESTESFTAKLQRIVNALDETHSGDLE